MGKYEAKFICGYCKKETPIDDETLKKIVTDVVGIHKFEPCSCGHFSYSSRITCKLKADTKDWVYRYGKA